MVGHGRQRVVTPDIGHLVERVPAARNLDIRGNVRGASDDMLDYFHWKGIFFFHLAAIDCNHANRQP